MPKPNPFTAFVIIADALEAAGVELPGDRPVDQVHEFTALVQKALDRVRLQHRHAEAKLFREDPEVIDAVVREAVAIALRGRLHVVDL